MISIPKALVFVLSLSPLCYTVHGENIVPVEKSDTIPDDFTNVDLEEVTVLAVEKGRRKMKDVGSSELITATELRRAACCSLAESFVTNPSVDVSYTDAATGARQIKLLGLNGTYVQMLTENVPAFTGVAAPYGLGYVPGPWMQSIQVSKGASSVKNGHESITGQINIEYKKPQDTQKLFFNAYVDQMAKMDLNADANFNLKHNWSTSLLGHYEKNFANHDENGDGFQDTPKVEQLNIMNRWSHFSDSFISQTVASYLHESRNSGQITHSHSGNSGALSDHLFKIGIKTDRGELFSKNAFVYDQDKSASVALITSVSLQDLDSDYGHKLYDVTQTSVFAQLLWESSFGDYHTISSGLNYRYDYYRQYLRDVHDSSVLPNRFNEHEAETGAYAQYTFNYKDKLSLMGGIRGDYNSLYGWFVTPRIHTRWTPISAVTLHANAGRGVRSTHPLVESSWILASGRMLVMDSNIGFEDAWNYGLGANFAIPLGSRILNFDVEYYYTDFRKQVVLDLDSDHDVSHFTKLNGDSYSHTFQAEATISPFRGFTITAAYRLTDVKMTYGGVLMQKPLTSKSKGLISLGYSTPMNIWQFDVTMQLNSGGRMPTPYEKSDGSLSWNSRYNGFEQLSAQITRNFRHFSLYIGGENITNYKQPSPIINASEPWSSSFDPTMIYGPLHGVVVYAGIRMTLPY